MIIFTKEQVEFIKKEVGINLSQGKEYDINIIGQDVYNKIQDTCDDIIEYEALNRIELEPTKRELMAEKISDLLYFDRTISEEGYK